MKTSVNMIGIAILALSVSACYSKDNFKIEVPKVKRPEIKIDPRTLEPDLSGFQACKKEESTQDFSKITAEKTVLKEASIQAQRTEFVACDKTTKDFGVLDDESVEDSFFIGPESDINEKVAFVEIENTRACRVFRLDVSSEEAAKEADARTSVLFEDNTVSITYTNSEYKLWKSVNVVDGKNLVQIRYFGACTKFKADAKDQSADNCEEAPLLLSQEMAIDLKVTRTLIDGVKQVDSCNKSNQKQ